MSTTHRDVHGEWLLEWQTDGRLDSEREEQLLGCSSCAEEARELLDVTRALERAAGRQREVELAADPDAPGQTQVEDTFRRLASGHADARKSPPRNGWTRRIGPWIALAAALAIAVFVWTPDEDTGGGGGAPTELGDDLVLIAPRGAVERFERFEWVCELPGIVYYELVIWDAQRSEAEFRPELPEDGETTWTPTAEQERDLPDRLRWRVDAWDASGGLVSSNDSGEAWRSSD